MSDDEFDELLEMVEREEAERNRDLGLDDMDVVIHATFMREICSDV